MSLLMLEPDRLAELAGYLRSGAPLAEHERALAATVLEDAALRCRPALAARLRQEALRTRNGLVYELGRLYFPDGSLRARAPPRFRTPATVRASSKRSRRTAGSSTRSGNSTWPRSASPRRAPTRLPVAGWATRPWYRRRSQRRARGGRSADRNDTSPRIGPRLRPSTGRHRRCWRRSTGSWPWQGSGHEDRRRAVRGACGHWSHEFPTRGSVRTANRANKADAAQPGYGVSSYCPNPPAGRVDHEE